MENREELPVRHTFNFIIILVLILTGCASASYEENNIPDRIGGDSKTMLLNYENRVKTYDSSNTESHMKIYLEIEKPYIISTPELKKPEKIYSIAAVEGTAIFRIDIGEKGTILGVKQIMSAGLGLDELAADILKQISVEPSYMAGKPCNSTADIKIKFRADKIQ